MSTLDLSTWGRFFGLLGAELCVIAVLAFVAHRVCGSRAWRRAIWQIALMCSVLVAVVEFTGAGKGMAVWLFGKPAPQRVVTVKILEPAPELMREEGAAFAAGRAPASQVAVSHEAFEFPKNCWWPGSLWVAGLALVLGRVLFAQGVFMFLRARRKRITDPVILTQIKMLSEKLGLKRRVLVYEMQRVSSPIAFGVVRSSIGIPVGFEQQFTRAQQTAMLAHELAHLRARDPFWYFVANLATAIFWWHPAVWWMRHQLHVCAEFAADEAVTLIEDGPVTLAECLVSFGHQLTASRPMNALGFGGFRSNLGKRVEALLKLDNTNFRYAKAWQHLLAKVCVPVLLVVLLFGTVGWFENRDAQREKDFGGTVQSSWGKSLAGMTLSAAQTERELRAFLAQTEPIRDLEASVEPRTASAQETFHKLETYRIPFFQAEKLALDEVVSRLSEEIVRIDPLSNGVQFSNDVSSAVTVSFLPLTNLVIQDLLGAIVVAADKPIRFSVTAKGVVHFRDRSDVNQQPPRYSEAFQIKLDTFETELAQAGFVIDNKGFNGFADDGNEAYQVWRVRPALSEFFVQKGIKLSSFVSFEILPQTSTLKVFGTFEDVGAVESAIDVFRAGNEGPKLYPRSLKVDAALLLKKLKEANISVEPLSRSPDRSGNFSPNFLASLNRALVEYFSREGVKLSPPESLFFDNRSGDLIVRASFTKIVSMELLTLPLRPAREGAKHLLVSPQLQDGHIEKRQLSSHPLVNRGDTPEPRYPFSITLDTNVFLREAEGYFSEHGQQNTIGVIKDYFRAKGVDGKSLDSFVFNESNASLWGQASEFEIQKIEAFPGVVKSPPLPRMRVRPSTQIPETPGISESRARSSALVQEGKVLFEDNKLDEAEKKLKAALEIDSENKAAEYYLQIIEENRSQRQLRGREFIYPTIPPKLAANSLNESSATAPVPDVSSLKQGQATRPDGLITRSYITNVKVVESALQRVFKPSQNGAKKTHNEMLGEFFALSVPLNQSSPSYSFFYNDITGALLVRASLEQHEAIEQAIVFLNQVPLQVSIQAKFAEVPVSLVRSSGNNWFVGDTLISSEGVSTNLSPINHAVAGTNMENSAKFTVHGILNKEQFKKLEHQLERAGGADVLTAPKVTTLSGRQAQISVLDLRTIVTGLEKATDTNGTSTSTFKTETQSFGPVLDVIPYVSENGQSIQMTVIATLKEFMGYEEPVRALQKVSKDAQLPLPRYRVRQAVTSALIPGGHTLVLGGLMADKTENVRTKVPIAGNVRGAAPSFHGESVKKEKRNLMVFVTPTIINANGLPVKQE